jgi:nucleotide-binding universal stress UspA family protein
LTVATQLSQRFDAHLVGLHAREPFEAPMFFDGGMPMDSLFRAYEDSAKTDLATSSAAFQKAIKGTHLSNEWRVVEGYVDNELAVQARYADLLIVGQTDPNTDLSNTPADLPEAVALSTGRPTLVVPHIGTKTPPGKNVLLCWNASRESARAAADALPFMKTADKVTVLVVDAKASGGDGPEPGADVANWLARHGAKVTVQRDVADDSDIGNVIMSRAADFDVDMIVMGIYGHSRMRELVLGGASRTILSSMTVPVLMSH